MGYRLWAMGFEVHGKGCRVHSPRMPPEWPLAAHHMATDCPPFVPKYPLNAPDCPPSAPYCPLSDPRMATTREHHARGARATTREHHARATTREHRARAIAREHHARAIAQEHRARFIAQENMSESPHENAVPGPSHKKTCQSHTGHHARAMTQGNMPGPSREIMPGLSHEKACQSHHETPCHSHHTASCPGG
jgi:hypothetical protein